MKLTLLEWQNKIKKVETLIVQASTPDHLDGWRIHPIGMCFGFVDNCDEKFQIGDHKNTVLCAMSIGNDQRRRKNTLNRKVIMENLLKNNINNIKLSNKEYFENLSNYKFVISPEGNGIDCHRHYEALIYGCIPIMEDNDNIRKKYTGCPILYTHDYFEITEEYLNNKYQEMINAEYDFSKLFLNYYDVATQKNIKNCGNYWTELLTKKKWYEQSNMLFIAVCNYGYIDVAENLILSFKRNHIENYRMYVLDAKSYTALSAKGYNVTLYNDINRLDCCDHQSEHFDEIAFCRYEIINTLLKDNTIVWYLDIDIVVLDNLNNYIPMFVDVDLCVQNDINMACSGCLLFFPTVNTITLTKIMYDNRNTKGIINDQILLNNVMRNNPDKLKLHVLDHNIFPNGLLYFNELHENPAWRTIQENFRTNMNQPLLVHANWIVGKDAKIKALKDKNLWYL